MKFCYLNGEKRNKKNRALGTHEIIISFLGFCYQIYQDRKKEGIEKYLKKKWLKTPNLVSEYERNPKEDKPKDNLGQTL